LIKSCRQVYHSRKKHYGFVSEKIKGEQGGDDIYVPDLEHGLQDGILYVWGIYAENIGAEVLNFR